MDAVIGSVACDRASHGRAPQAQERSAALGWTPQEMEDLLNSVQPLAQ